MDTKTIIIIAVAIVAVLLAILLALAHPWSGPAGNQPPASTTAQSSSVSESTGQVTTESSASKETIAKEKKKKKVQKHKPATTGASADRSYTYHLSTVTVNGEVLSGTVHRTVWDEVIPSYASKYYTKDEIRDLHLNDAELCIALNEPLAMQGRHFKNSDIRAYFNSCVWYEDEGLDQVSLSGAAKNNYDIIKQLIDERGSEYRWFGAVLY